MVFKDYFSATAADYATYRPNYPDGLFAFLAEGRDELIEVLELSSSELAVGQQPVPEAGLGEHRVEGYEGDVLVVIGHIGIAHAVFDAEEVFLEKPEFLFEGVGSVPAVIVVARNRHDLETRPV